MGKYFPSVKSLIKLREIFGVSMDYILGLSEDRHDIIQVADLKRDEAYIITLYRKADFLGRERAKAYLEGYLDALYK